MGQNPNVQYLDASNYPTRCRISEFAHKRLPVSMVRLSIAMFATKTVPVKQTGYFWTTDFLLGAELFP